MEASSITQSFCEVNGLNMAFREIGNPGGIPIVFLHGNPTSSFLWRNIMPVVADGIANSHCIAPDLIGMGDSDKLPDSGPGSYSYQEHLDFVTKFMSDCINQDMQDVILVLQDWGSGIGFRWAFENQDNVMGIAHFESMVRPFVSDDMPPGFELEFFEPLRTPGVGEQLVLEDNFFVEVMLPSAIIRNLTEDEFNEYRKPFLNPGEDRRPTLMFPREIPIDGIPEDVAALLQEYSDWLKDDQEIPKLLLLGDPGALIGGTTVDFALSFKNQDVVNVTGIHFLQEDSPVEIGNAVVQWYMNKLVKKRRKFCRNRCERTIPRRSCRCGSRNRRRCDRRCRLQAQRRLRRCVRQCIRGE